MANYLTIERISEKYPNAVRILADAPVLYNGWEMDNEICAVEMSDGSVSLVTTSHGRIYIAKTSELTEKIAEYEQAIEQSKTLLTLIK
jgi:hypothetical protein